MLFEEVDDADAKNMLPKKKLKVRKAKLCKQLGVSCL